MYQTNLQCIETRIDKGLALLRQYYEVTERAVGNFRSFTVAGRRHEVRQFDVQGVGNLLVMTNPDEGPMQMDTFTITPYFKNLPLFTTDYMYFEDKRMILNEIYNLVEEQDALYLQYIDEFARNCKAVESLEDMPMRPCWYDEIRPVFAGKIAPLGMDTELTDLFLANLQTFIRMEQASPLLTGSALQGKWNRNYAYARSLVEDGGVSTDLFTKSLGEAATKEFFYSVFFAPDCYRPPESDNLSRVLQFFAEKDENGITNEEKVKQNQKIIRRVDTTDSSRSYEAVDKCTSEKALPLGMVTENGKLIGLGIHIFNEDVYPLQSFEIYLRNCNLCGRLDLSDSRNLIYLDLYHNRVEEIVTGELPNLRIFGVQDNALTSLDVCGMPSCQGIDAGQNRLSSLDVSRNGELVELYINDNCFRTVDLSGNPRLKYFYCHNNQISSLDTRANPLLRHLNATGNPMKDIFSLAPQREETLPLELHAKGGGYVGLKFCPVYNAQWKETGEWQQSYCATPTEGYTFTGWYDADGNLVQKEALWMDEYGASRILTAEFSKN